MLFETSDRQTCRHRDGDAINLVAKDNNDEIFATDIAFATVFRLSKQL